MPKGRQIFTKTELKNIISAAKEHGAVSVDIMPEDRSVIYRVNLIELPQDKKRTAYNWDTEEKTEEFTL